MGPVEQPRLLGAGQGRAQLLSLRCDAAVLKLLPGKIPLSVAPCCYGVAVDGETQVGMDPSGFGSGQMDRRSDVCCTRYRRVILLPCGTVVHPLGEPTGGQILALRQSGPASQAERVHLSVPGHKGPTGSLHWDYIGDQAPPVLLAS